MSPNAGKIKSLVGDVMPRLLFLLEFADPLVVGFAPEVGFGAVLGDVMMLVPAVMNESSMMMLVFRPSIRVVFIYLVLGASGVIVLPLPLWCICVLSAAVAIRFTPHASIRGRSSTY